MKKLVNTYKLIALFSFGLLISSNALSQVWSLDKCLDTAMEHNKSLKIAKNNQQISKARQKEAAASLWPKLNLLSEYKYFTDLPTQLLPAAVFGGQPGQFKEAQFGVPHNLSAQLQFAMPLYQPQAFGALKLASVAREVTDLQFQKTEQQLYYDITSTYYSAQLIGQQLIMLEKNLENTKRLLNNLRLLQTQQMAKGTDVEKIFLQEQQLLAQNETVNAKYQQMLNYLKVLMGVDPGKNLEIISEIKSDLVISQVSNENMDLKLIKTQNKFLKRELLTTKTLTLPSLNLVGSYGTTGFGYDKTPNDFLKFYPLSFVGLQLSLPVFNGGSLHQKNIQKKLEIKNNELQTALMEDQTNIQIVNLRDQIKIYENQIGLTQKHQDLAQSIYSQTLLQQKEGLASLTEVLMADTAHREAQQAHFAAMIEYLKALADLKKITGNFNK